MTEKAVAPTAAPPATSTKPNGLEKKAQVLTPLQALAVAVKAGNKKIEDAIQEAYKLGYADGVIDTEAEG